ncbi:MAG TPA: hypothetical protein VJ571_00530 [Candidatus Nitrosotalea sp.]|nr:hypothetical protein [Candidatus Nitrosotalea sp.]
MSKEPEDVESELIKQMFDEIMKMIREKQIRLETIIQRTIEQENMQQESFNRIYHTLTEYGKKKQWLSP